MNISRVVKRLAAAVAVVAVATSPLLTAPVAGSPPPPHAKSLGAGGLSGSAGIVESVNTPARISRVAVVPGTNGADVWAIGHLTSYQGGWNRDDRGQLVFLRNQRNQGWAVVGPPKDGTTVVNPSLTALTMAKDGEGWAVGSNGTIIHRAPGENSEWRLISQCGQLSPPAVTCASLEAVAVHPLGTAGADGNLGYAVGSGGTVLVLKANREWAVDPRPVVPSGGLPPAFAGVALSQNEVWAIAANNSDASSRGLDIYRRDNGQWTSYDSGKRVLEEPLPTTEGGQLRFGVRGKAAAADAVPSSADGTIWFSGSLFPFDPAKPDGDASTGGTSERPFTLRFRDVAPTGEITAADFVSYCPVVYTASTEQVTEFPVCDAPMPMSAYPATTLSVVPGGEVFAGGFGLYHFRPSGGSGDDGRGTWFREPDPVGRLGSVSFANGREGWLASSGDQVGSTSASTESMAVGHYTPGRGLPQPRIARWANPRQSIPYAVAVPSSPTARPVTIGEAGIVLRLSEVGWTEHGSVGGELNFLAVEYAGTSNTAWAVGEAGRVVPITDSGVGSVSEVFTSKDRKDTLYDVAFSAANRGWAVGATGSLVSYNGASWDYDRAESARETRETLYSVDVLSNGLGFVAVGSNGTVLVNPTGTPGQWSKVPQARSLLTFDGTAPHLYAVDALPDGTIVAGGRRSALIEAQSVGKQAFVFKSVPSPAEGTILALVARREAGVLKMVVSIGPRAAEKWAGGDGSTTQGWLSSFDGSRWHDLQNRNKTRLAAGLDHAIATDPVYTLAAEPSGTSGWAVGGRVAGLIGPEPNDDYHRLQTGSVYRFDLAGDPRSPLERETTVQPTVTPEGYSFAFFSDTACGSTLCSLTAGTGTAADEIALRIRDDINAAAKLPGGPKFVLFGGSARGTGTREEIAQFAAYLSGFNIPVFGAPGARDLAVAVTDSNPDDPLPYNLEFPIDVDSRTRTTGSNIFYQQEFRHQRQPWGSGPAGCTETGPSRCGEEGFVPVPSSGTLNPDRARTHYAFDYQPRGASKPLGRFVVIDTSTRSLNTAGQNPVESQGAWLADTLVQARSAEVPTFVVMNTPPRDPSSFNNDPLLPVNDVATVEQAIYSGGATAVFAGGVKMNGTYTQPSGVPSSVRYFVAGTGGGALDGSRQPTDGRYHAWLLANVDPTVVNVLRPQAALNVRTVPVIESVSLLPRRGLVVAGGNTLKFDALARGIDGGGPHEDDRAVNRLYQQYPVQSRCESGGDKGTSPVSCFGVRALVPDYKFISEDPAIADFVRPVDLGREFPSFASGRLQPDPFSGFLCSFRTGQVWVRIEAGGRSARLPVTVRPGSGPCVDVPVDEPIPLPEDVDPVPVPDKPDPVRNAPEPPPAKAAKVPTPAPPQPAASPPPPPQPVEPTPVVKPVPKTFFVPQPLAQLTPALVPPAPSLLPSPAPPASASAAGAEKQEDKEVEHQGADQEGGEFVAIRHRSETFDPAQGLMLTGVAILLGVFGAATAASRKAARGRTARAHIQYPRELR